MQSIREFSEPVRIPIMQNPFHCSRTHARRARDPRTHPRACARATAARVTLDHALRDDSFINFEPKNEPNKGVRYIVLKLSAWAIRHGMTRNGYVQGWGELERF